MLSQHAQRLADAIAYQDWSDAPFRQDRAGHRREDDSRRTPKTLALRETDFVRWNAAMVVCQVLWDEDPNLDKYEFVAACGVAASKGEIDHALQDPWKD